MKQIQVLLVALVALLFPNQSVGVGEEFGHLVHSRVKRGEAGDWCYENEDCSERNARSQWNTDVCGTGTRQSPINIVSADATASKDAKVSTTLSLLKDSNYDINEYAAKVGKYSVHIEVPDDTKARFQWIGNNTATYKLASIHFHWGPNSSVGSEHTIDGKSTAMEMHLVHYRSEGPESHSDIISAIKSGKGNALSVIGFMLKVDPENKPESGKILEPLMTNDGVLGKMQAFGDIIEVKDLPLKFDKELRKQKSAYTYKGSLTTPGCSEIVMWTVLKDPVAITEDQVEEFRIRFDQPLTYRTPQPLKGRKVRLVDFKSVSPYVNKEKA